MSVKCEKCGYVNDLQHAFCGMCGAKLPASPAPSASADPPASQKVEASGASMLGLAHEPSTQDRVAYLLQDDEPPPKSPLRFIIPLLILAGLAWAGWHWRDTIRTLVAGNQGTENQEATSTISPPAPSDTTAPQPQATAPAPAANPPAPAPQAAAPAASSAPSPTAAAPADQTNNAAPAQQSTQAPPAQTPLGSTETPDAAPADKTPAPSDAQDQTAAATPPPSLPKANPKTKPKPSSAQPAEGDDQESEGEKYLYGNGLTADCGKASKSLMASARKGNAKAQSVVGSMYATGHCVSRDLPTAYGWFAKALHQDPNNRRYAGDLEVVWRQMTQAERQLALKAGQ
jgi:hypothetical protein